MTDARTVHFEGHGPKAKGMETWEPFDPKNLTAGTPIQRGHLYLDDKARGVMAGVWDCTPFTGKMGAYPVNEFMHVLEGSVTIVEPDGKETTVRAGESFILPKGLVCQWKQTEYVRKFFVIFDDTSGAKAGAAKPGVIKIDTGAALGPMDIPDTSMFIGPVPKQTVRSWFADATGQMTVGVWATTPFTRKVAPFPRHELMHLLEGSVTIADGAGGSQTFKAGDTFLVPEGAPISWSNAEPVKKIYCIFKARAAASAAAE